MFLTIDKTLLSFIITMCVVSIVIVVIFILLNIRKNYKIKRMYSDVYASLLKIIEDRKIKEHSTLEVVEKKAYNFFFETRTHIYYIKVVPNFKNHEICVNNRTKWQINSSLNDSSVKFVENIDGLMNMDVSYPTKKIVKKLYVIYPNARSLLKYINECELAFVYADTDVYGCNIITYQTLIEHPNYIEGK